MCDNSDSDKNESLENTMDSLASTNATKSKDGQGQKQNRRKRKKQYFNAIRKQMEFYFSDANLTKDRFLKKLIASDPFVPLSTFMNFNKIKEMATSVDDIEKAIYNSELLELSCDKQRVRRITEIQIKDDVDEFTVYVEGLSPCATHESVRNQFKQFGPIAYVSLPKYRSSGKIKEFAFVEFEQRASVERCVNGFRQFDGVINDNYQPAKMQSIVSYLKEQDDLDKDNNSDANPIDEYKDLDSKHNVIDSTEANADRESVTDASDVESVTSQPVPTKRIKLNDNETDPSYDYQPTSSKPDSHSGSVDGEKGEEIESNDNREDEGADFDDEYFESNDDPCNKRPRRKRRKARQTGTNQLFTMDPIQPQPQPNYFGENLLEETSNSINLLRVATKPEWKRLRNKYLTLQREQYAQAKKLFYQKKEVKPSQKVSTLPQLPRPVTIKNKPYSDPPSAKQICTRNINFYGANTDDPANSDGLNNHFGNNSTPTAKSNANNRKEGKTVGDKSIAMAAHLAKPSQIEFVPGVIVKVNFDEPCVDVADFKAEMKQHSFVRYVDLKEGQTSAHVRVDVPRSAPILIKHCAPHRCQILVGDIETEYWQKIVRDREQKLSKAVKTSRGPRKRIKKILESIVQVDGNQLGPKSVATHIRFDE